MLKKGIIVKSVQKPTCVNPLSVSQKFCYDTKQFKYRVCLDLSRHLNKQFVSYTTTLDDYKTLIPHLEMNNYMASFDLEAAYHHIKLDPSIVKFFGFSIQSENNDTQYYYFRYLVFGLKPAVYCMNKCTRPLMVYCHDQGIKTSIYIDDQFNTDTSSDKCWFSYLFMVFVFKTAGWSINSKKSSTQPLQKLKYLGFIIETTSMKIFAPDEKLKRIIETIDSLIVDSQNKLIYCRRLASVLGNITHLYNSHGTIVKILTRQAQHLLGQDVTLKGWKCYLQINSNVVEELKLLSKNLTSFNGAAIHKITKEVEVITPSQKTYLVNNVHPDWLNKEYTVFVSDASNSHSFVYEASKFSVIQEYKFTDEEAEQSSSYRIDIY